MLKQANPEWGCQRISDMLLRGPALPASAAAVARVLHEAGYQMEEVTTHPHPGQTAAVRHEQAGVLADYCRRCKYSFACNGEVSEEPLPQNARRPAGTELSLLGHPAIPGLRRSAFAADCRRIHGSGVVQASVLT